MGNLRENLFFVVQMSFSDDDFFCEIVTETATLKEKSPLNQDIHVVLLNIRYSGVEDRFRVTIKLENY